MIFIPSVGESIFHSLKGCTVLLNTFKHTVSHVVLICWSPNKLEVCAQHMSGEVYLFISSMQNVNIFMQLCTRTFAISLFLGLILLFSLILVPALHPIHCLRFGAGSFLIQAMLGWVFSSWIFFTADLSKKLLAPLLLVS